MGLINLLDELAFDYSRINLQMQQLEEHMHIFHHPEAKDFLYHLRRLRDVLQECAEREITYSFPDSGFVLVFSCL